MKNMRGPLILLLVLTLFPCAAGAEDPAKPRIVMLIAEREYQTEKSLTQFAKQHLDAYETTFVFASPDDKHNLSGIETVAQADLLLVSVRRRTLPGAQLDYVRKYVAAGKPVIGIRTANHAFCLRNQQPAAGKTQWTSWDQDVFGGNYTNHYGNSLITSYAVTAEAPAALVRGIDRKKSFSSSGSLYKVAPLADGAKVILTGAVAGNKPEPMAWTFTRADGGKSFYTSLGHVDDFTADVLPRLLLNAIDWALASN
jgi:type 1 glutamine amidotransferase